MMPAEQSKPIQDQEMIDMVTALSNQMPSYPFQMDTSNTPSQIIQTSQLDITSAGQIKMASDQLNIDDYELSTMQLA